MKDPKKQAFSFNQDYLRTITKELFLESHSHLSHLPLEAEWESANKTATLKSEKSAEKAK